MCKSREDFIICLNVAENFVDDFVPSISEMNVYGMCVCACGSKMNIEPHTHDRQSHKRTRTRKDTLVPHKVRALLCAAATATTAGRSDRYLGQKFSHFENPL